MICFSSFLYPVIKFCLPIMHSVSIRFRNIVQSSSNLSSIFSYSSHKCQLCHMLFINLVFSLCHFRLISFLTGKRLLSVRYILCILDRESSTLTAASFFYLFYFLRFLHCGHRHYSSTACRFFNEISIIGAECVNAPLDT